MQTFYDSGVWGKEFVKSDANIQNGFLLSKTMLNFQFSFLCLTGYKDWTRAMLPDTVSTLNDTVTALFIR